MKIFIRIKKLPHYLKRILQNITILCLTALALISAKPPADIFKEIENALSLGNAKMMETYLNTSIELETPTSKGIYSRGQAQLIIDKFFQKYPPISFTITQKGNSAGGARFAVGNYVSTRERTFRVTIFVKKSGTSGN